MLFAFGFPVALDHAKYIVIKENNVTETKAYDMI